MLVLSRRPAETIRIGDDVVIRVVKCGPGRVKLAIKAPRDVRIERGELEETPAASDERAA